MLLSKSSGPWSECWLLSLDFNSLLKLGVSCYLFQIMSILLSDARSKSLGHLLCELIEIRFRYSYSCSWAG